MSTTLDRALKQLVIANKILTHKNLADAEGHISIRTPDIPSQYVISRNMSPREVTGLYDWHHFRIDDERSALEGIELYGDKRLPFGENFLHSAMYETRPDVNCVVHVHMDSVIPWSIIDLPLRPMIHWAAKIGDPVPVWDPQDEFGDTNMAITDHRFGHSLAKTLGSGFVALMRGHGAVVVGRTIQEAVLNTVYLDVAARAATTAHLLSGGKVHYLSEGERNMAAGLLGNRWLRPWNAWCAEVGMRDDD